jgi:3-hydroxymyristoyl/3-hydroxydecanoyl-(acyl carrier protein) dehydratase
MSFSFVDWITAIESDRAHGMLRRAHGAPPLPPWLVIEAVGQLAAWIAMARSDFVSRPVAALVGEVRLSGADEGGSVDLEARIDRLDGRAILYSGSARAGATLIAELARCVGPLLPAEVFDDPAALRQRLAALRAGAPAAGTGGAEGEIPRAHLAAIDLDEGSARAQLHIPTAAPFFADHFPRRPVYPASLLADAQNQLAGPLAARVLGVAPARARLSRVADFKVRSFSPPGQTLELVAEVRPPAGVGVRIAVSASTAGKRIASGGLEYCLAPPV